MPDIKHLKEQVERARRLAASMTTSSDRNRLGAIANEYQRQIDALTARESELQQSMPHDHEPDATGTSDDTATKSGDKEPEME